MSTLQILSLLGLALYFIALLVAVTKEKKNENIMDYFFAGRSLPFWALSITFIASWWGAGSAISTADLAYYDGLGAFWYYGVPVLVSTFLMILCSKAIRRVGYLTQGEMMKARYSESTAKMLSVMIFIFMTVTAASQMVGIGEIFGAYLGLSYESAVLIGTAIVLIYSMFGGFRGVVLTDIIQFVLLVISAVIVFFIAMKNAGGFSGIKEIAITLGKPGYTNFFNGAGKYFSYVITFGCAWMIQANVWQRISAAKNDLDAKKMTVMSFFAYIPLYLIVVITGMCGIVMFKDFPSGGIVATIVLQYMNPLLGAVVFVGLSAAIMSTMDSLINTGAMTLAIDLAKSNKTDIEKLRFSRIATLIVTFIALLISLKIRSILEVSWIASDIITTGVFVPLMFGFFFKPGNSKGAMASMITGLFYSIYNLLVSFGVKLPVCWDMQSTKQVIIGVFLSLFMYIGVSLVTKTNDKQAINFINKASLLKRK